MTPDGKGKFCASCNKTVVDFSKFTDKELAEFFKKLRGAVCGSFYEDQLNRPIAIPVENNNSFLSKALFGTALLAGIASHSNAQAPNEAMPFKQVPLPVTPLNNNEKETFTNSTIIKGTVHSKHTRKPLEYVSVCISGTSYRTHTDSTGTFTVVVPDSLKEQNITLEFRYIRYKEHDVAIKPGEYPSDLKVGLHRRHHIFRRRRVSGFCAYY